MENLYLKSAYFVLTLFTLCSGQLIITGNEEPLTIGLSQDINCTWSGEGNVSRMEWFVVGLEAVAIETAEDSWSVVLTLTPDDDGLDRAMFLCKATLTNSLEIEETITLSVQAIENEVVISASEMNATAGQAHTLLCTVSSERPSNLSWVDPNGVACPLDDPDTTVSYSGWIGGLSTLELTFHSIRTSQSGVYKCISNIAFPSSKSEDAFLVKVQIPPPSVTILRDPVYPVQLFSSHSLVLTCVIELIPEVDSYISVDSRWSGHSALTDRERRVIVSDLRGIQLTYNTSVTIRELKSSDSGSYVCSASVTPGPNPNNLIDSSHVEETIRISVALKVTIEVTYDPPSDFNLPSPPYYRPASTVTLTCRAHSPVGSASYEWYSTCSECFTTDSISQSVSQTILQSNDAGVHTCTATDSVNNTGRNSTEMKLIGIGMYVQYSEYINGMAVKNNSLIVQKQSYCEYCKVDIYCYSNSSSQNVGYYLFPDGGTVYSDSNHYYYYVHRTGYSGLRMRNYHDYTPDIWGIFTCQLPDSEGNTLETSIGIYSSMPSPASVYSVEYTDWSENNSDILGSLECLTQNSPPTSVTWLRDGVPVEVDGVGVEMIQTVMERQSYSRYNNTLLIRDAAQLAGSHTYHCTVSNAAGNSTNWVDTTLTVQPIVHISVAGDPHDLRPFNVTCTTSFQHKVVSRLIRYLVLDWVRADGVSISDDEDVMVGEQNTFVETATKSLTFDPLRWPHCGDYICEAKLLLPSPAGSFNTSLQYHLNTLNTTLVQLKFGPVVHCSKWYEDKHIAGHMEMDIKQALVTVINNNCTCGFVASQINQGEFSCRNMIDGHVTYRAQLTGNCDTLTIPEILELIREWIARDGTFLYTYHGNIRLEMDRDCPLEISLFSEPECKNTHFKTEVRIEL